MATMVQQIHLSDKVRVALVMGNGKIIPRWFEQTDKPSRERIQVQGVCSTWSYHDGTARIVCFAVTDGCNSYQLEFNTRELTWRLGQYDYSLA
jgi:hypothetical protein